MKTTKMSLANIQGKLSRAEMKEIMAGSGGCASSFEACGSNGKVCCSGLECDGLPPNTSCQPCVWPNCPGN